MRGRRWISGLLLAGACALPASRARADADPAGGVDPALTSDTASGVNAVVAADTNSTGSDLAALARKINEAKTDKDRLEAARQLVSRDSPAAKSTAQSLLNNANNPAARVAVANAIAASADPDPVFITSLGKMLGGPPAVHQSACKALVAYPDRSEPFQLLRAFVDNRSNPTALRSSCINEMASLLDKAVAQYLIDRLGDASESDSLRDHARSALSRMTTLDYSTPAQWKAWWQTEQNGSADHFQAEIEKAQLRQKNAQLTRLNNLGTEAEYLLRKDYVELPDAEKNTALLDYLKSSSPLIQLKGLSLIDEFLTRGAIPEVLKPRLREMISESDPGVRRVTAVLMRNRPDAGAAHALVAQLAVEKVPEVKAALLQAVAQLDDPAAAVEIFKALDDPKPDISQAAVSAFAGPLGERIGLHDIALSRQVSERIRQLLKKNDDDPQPDDNYREACMKALAALRDPGSLDTFRDGLKKVPESAGVRRAALDGLGNLADPRGAAEINEALDDQDQTIRLEAARALRSVPDWGLKDRLLNLMRQERDSAVREAIWQDLVDMLPRQKSNTILNFAGEFDNDPARQLAILQIYGKASGVSDDDIAANNENIGHIYLDKLKPSEPAKAVDYLQKALDYCEKASTPDDRTNKVEGLVTNLMEAKLETGRYSDAMDFAARYIATYHGRMTTPILNKIDTLIAQNDFQSAQTLVDSARKIPNLDADTTGRLNERQQTIDQRAPARH